jgi:peptide/nickel transport system ATP-binding protein
VCTQPRHPYTQALFDACLPDDPDAVPKAAALAGEMPSPLSPPTGCRFHPRCPKAQAVCSQAEPPLKELTPDHRVACVLY